MNNPPVISIRNAQFGYVVGLHFLPVIKKVNVDVLPGQFVVLEGPNGCGKSTILKAMLNMGARWKGSVSMQIDKSHIGYIPQEAMLQLSAPATAYDVVCSAFPFGKAPRLRILQSLFNVGLAGKEFKRFGTLSGGQRRRVLLARALSHRAKLIILDEPTANIDKKSEAELERVLYAYIAEGDNSVLATTHASHWAKDALRIPLLSGDHHE